MFIGAIINYLAIVENTIQNLTIDSLKNWEDGWCIYLMNEKVFLALKEFHENES